MLRLDGLRFLDWRAISLAISSGEVACLMGGSGSGKSLLLRAVADLIPRQGKVWLDDEESGEVEPGQWRRRVGYLPAETLWWEDRVEDHYLNRPENQVLAELGLSEECLSWEVSRLSMGERQRLGILRLLDRGPRALLLDEPTSNLDERTARSVESLLLGYVERTNGCALWVTHDEGQARRIGNRSFLMANKSVQEVGRG
ncbi:ATP-binding cassette domain-containing protein [Pelagicoccus sp. SDUM812003]|uniref:ABC transporter ATP-binding protein n=1 Tax=Pelagicoccus sp. SDUM812003 TaxID=3041267 RepID=UPI0028100DE6|nr:ATP-binding cassette domain-containing protein [Pelagicoccus sp. SDUM812003]MDQ8202271.1 ATP-binding cassette domain-containing protein [Pelagicoccus sp. SDUM812003]